ncbi:hypothetical protein PJI17_09430 [Mycobacterium kansasii]
MSYAKCCCGLLPTNQTVAATTRSTVTNPHAALHQHRPASATRRGAAVKKIWIKRWTTVGRATQ